MASGAWLPYVTYIAIMVPGMTLSVPFTLHPSAQHTCLLLTSDPAMLVRASLRHSGHLPHSILAIPSTQNALPTSNLWTYVLCAPLNVIHPEKDAGAPVCVLLLAHSRPLVSFGWTFNLDLSNLHSWPNIFFRLT